MADSRELAWQNLFRTRDYIFAVSDDFARGVNKGWLKPKDNKDHKELWNNYATLVEKPFVAFYNECDEKGISRIDVDTVNAECSAYINKARTYQEKLEQIAKAAGGDTVTPIAPEDKPPPSILSPINQGLSDMGSGLAWAGAGALAIGLLILLKKLYSCSHGNRRKAPSPQ